MFDQSYDVVLHKLVLIEVKQVVDHVSARQVWHNVQVMINGIAT